MRFHQRTGEGSAVTYGWVGMLLVVLFQAAAMAIEIAVRVTVVVVTWIVRGVRWLVQATLGGGADGPAFGDDDLPRGASAPDPGP